MIEKTATQDNNLSEQMLNLQYQRVFFPHIVRKTVSTIAKKSECFPPLYSSDVNLSWNRYSVFTTRWSSREFQVTTHRHLQLVKSVLFVRFRFTTRASPVPSVQIWSKLFTTSSHFSWFCLRARQLSSGQSGADWIDFVFEVSVSL